MRNIFLFLRRYSNFFLFLFLQVFCLVVIFRFNRFHNAVGMTMAGRFTGRIHEKASEIRSFFKLGRTNDSLVRRMAELQNARTENYLLLDTSRREKADMIPIDTMGHFRKEVQFIYRPATVVYKTENDDKKNYLMLARGVKDGVNRDMAVIGAESNAIIGKVVYADANYSMVMSLLHVQSVVSAKLARTGETGAVTWDGRHPNYVTLNRIPKTAEVKKGDTVVTGNSSTVFPAGLVIGTIDAIEEEKTTGNYRIRLKTKADFYNVQYVFVVENMMQQGMNDAIKNTNREFNSKPQ